MNFLISSTTDAGIKKQVNQDSLFAQRIKTETGNMALAVLCDGMGGHQFGEIASAALIEAFADWMYEDLPVLAQKPLEDYLIRAQWSQIVQNVNDKIRAFGRQNECIVGSTITALLLTERRFFLLNIGDTRAYKLGKTVEQLTVDHTLIAKELMKGNITKEQAESSPIQNILTKCVGVEESVYPDLFFGEVQQNVVYMLCSDGFRHYVTEKEIYAHLYCQGRKGPKEMKYQEEHLIFLNKQRGETDNISVITICTN